MDRRLIVGLFGLFLAGCAQARSGMPEIGNREPLAQADSLPSIKDSINQTSAATDPATRRASHDPATLNPPRNSGRGDSTSATPPMDPPIPPGRPAPYAGLNEGKLRPQAPPASGRPEDQLPEARPAPFADKLPTAPRPVGLAAPGTTSNLPALPPLLPPKTPPEVVAAEVPKVDAAVVPTAGPGPLPKPSTMAPIKIGEGGRAAMVGTEVITLDQLRRVLKEQLEKVSPQEKNDPDVQRMLVEGSLNKLIERTLIIQAVKKQIKDPKALQGVYDSMDKGWVEQELPPILRKTNSANIHELKRKYAEQGKSLDAIREDFRFEVLSHEFLLSKIQSKMHASLPEKRQYYLDHLKDFDQPAQYVWSEIAIENAKCASRAEAKEKIDAILARVKKNEDFAKIARGESHGATAREGGRWEVAPGGYGVPEINEAINALAPGQLSGVIEAPGGFHIVRVDSKRTAGPARFDEVQDKIKDLILRQKFARYSDAYINNLRSNTVVTTMFDKDVRDPSAVRTSGESPLSR